MKKFFTLCAAIVAAMSMNATYYVAGNGAAGDSWCDGKYWDAKGSAMNESNEITFVGVKGGVYQFKVTEGDWQHQLAYEQLDKENSTKGAEDSGGNIKFTAAAGSDVNIKVVDGKIVLTFVPTVVEITVWSVYGVEELGLSWELNKGADMTLVDDVWKLEQKNVVIAAAGGYNYKVAANHDWSVGQYPEGQGNNTLSIAADGTYDIVYTWNPEKKELTAVATSVPTAVENVAVEAKAIKVVENGQIVIIRDGVRYNAVGAAL